MSHSTTTPLQGNRNSTAWTALSTTNADSPELPQNNKAVVEVVCSNNDSNSSLQPEPAQSGAFGTWLPYTLRRAFLSGMAVVSLSFSATLVALCVYSARNHGLGRDDRSVGLLIAWRYTPTILAVLFTQAIVMIYDDIKRTESFARLARPDQTDASYALHYVPKAWWKSVLEGCSRKRNSGHIGWVLLFSSILTGLSLLAISTLSSSLLVPKQILVRSTENLRRFSFAQDGISNLAPQRETYFHTTSGYVYNVSTSMWVSDSHVVLPFRPDGSDMYSDFLPEGVWQAETKVLQMESSCVPMTFIGPMNATHSYIYESDNMTFTYNSAILDANLAFVNRTANDTFQGMLLRSEDGCEIELHEVMSSHPIMDEGGLFWSNLSSTYISWQDFTKERGDPPFFKKTTWSPLNNDAAMEFSQECLGRNLLLVTTPWRLYSGSLSSFVYWKDFQYRAELCTPAYYEATVSVNASVSASDRRITFDEDEFKKNRIKLGNDQLGTEEIELFTFKGNKPGYVSKASIFKNTHEFEGLNENLQTHYSFNTTTMLQDSTIAVQASRLRSRFFAELLFSSVTEQQSPVLEDVVGQRILLERRVVVVTEVAITLAVLFFCLTCYFVYLAWGVSVQRRPLNLSTDPATVLGATTFFNHVQPVAGADNAVSTRERKGENTSKQSMSDLTTSESHTAKHRAVSTTNTATGTTASPDDWRSTLIRTKGLMALLFLVAVVAASLLVLQNFADRQQLYRSAFVYEVDMGVFRAQISPASLCATLIAVCLALWWDMIDNDMRHLQPYLSMAQRPVDVKHGAALSYESSHWIWAAGKAASNKHWLLFLVTLGTTLSQILIVAMAAVFERQAGVHARPITVDRAFATRQDHLTYQHTNVSSDADFFQNTMRTVTGDWLYSALDQLTLQAEPPAWSRDGWSFTPIVMESLPEVSLWSKREGLNQQHEGSELFFSVANVSLSTSAIRARLECDRITPTDTSWYNMNETAVLEEELSKSVKNMTGHLNVTGYILPRTIFDDDPYRTTIFTTPSRVFCCANGTDSNSNSAIGYWSHVNPDQWWADRSAWAGFGPKAWPGNFTIKWIVGPTTTTDLTIYTNSQPSYYKLLQFTEIPAMEILTCRPVIEQTDAHVTVARSSGQVVDFELLGDPQPQHDIWDMDFDAINLNGSLEERFDKNYTAEMRYAVYFMTQLLYAASSPTTSSNLFNFEDLEDERFNIRDKDKGLNMDFMSFSNYFQANKDSMALLDADTLFNYSQHTFQTFFQHFASQTKWIHGEPMAHQAVEGQKADVVTTERIEVLIMVKAATWLCLSVLFLLMLILMTLMVWLKRVYPPTTMLGDMECLADVLAMIENSHELRARVERSGVAELKGSGMRTRLGWFRDAEGVVRWGVEMVGEDGVEWVEKHEGFHGGEDGVERR